MSRYPDVGVAVTKSSNWLTLSVGTVETKSSMRLPVMTERGRADITEPGLAIIWTGRGKMGEWCQPPIITTGLITLTWELQMGPRASLEGEHEVLLTVHAMIFVFPLHAHQKSLKTAQLLQILLPV